MMMIISHLLDGAVVVEVASLLALPCAPQWPIGTDLEESKSQIYARKKHQQFFDDSDAMLTWPKGQLESLLHPGLQTFSSQYSPARQ